MAEARDSAQVVGPLPGMSGAEGFGADRPGVSGLGGGGGLGDERQPELRATCCPQCAGPLRTIGETRTLRCDRCGVRLLVPTEDGYSRWFFRPRVERLQAVARVSEWLEKHPAIRNSARRAHVVEARLLYLPIWEYRALVVGWEFGQRLRTHLVYQPVVNITETRVEEETLQLATARESVQEGQLHERRFYQSAVDLDALGVNRPRITGREFALPLLPGEIDPEAFVLEAEGSAAEMAEVGRKMVLAPVSGASSPDAHLFALRETTTLLYYPLWSLHYVYKDRRYAVMVDGRSGMVHSGRAPAANGGHVGQFVGLSTLFALVLALLAHAVPGSDHISLPAVAAGVIVSAAALVSAWRFRLQGEVEYHEPFSS